MKLGKKSVRWSSGILEEGDVWEEKRGGQGKNETEKRHHNDGWMGYLA